MQTNFQKLHPAVLLAFYILLFSLVFIANHPLELLIIYFALLTSIIYRNYLFNEYLLKNKWGLYLLPIFTMIISGLINSLFRHYGLINLFRFSNGNYYTLDSLINGAVGGFRIGLAVLLLKHMSEVLTTNSLLFLFKGFLPKIALLFTMLLRFFPRYLNEAKDLNTVNRLGIESKQLNFSQRWQNRADLIAKLSSWGLESSIQTAEYMQARGLGQAKKKTSYRLYSWRQKDSYFSIFLILSSVLYIILRKHGLLKVIYYPFLYIYEWQSLNLLMLLVLALISFLPLLIDLRKY